MKIIKNTQKILKFNNKQQWSFKDIAISSLFFGIPIFFTSGSEVLSSGAAKLSCTKLERTIAACELSTSTFIGLIQNESTSIDRVQSAIVETVNNIDSDGYSISEKQVFLVTNKEKIRLPNQFDDGDTKLINKYLQIAVGGLVIEKDNRLEKFIQMLSQSLAIFLFVRGSYKLTEIFTLDTYIFDKNVSAVTIKSNSKNRVTKHSLQEISQVEVAETEDSDGDKSYEVRLLMNGGDSLSLCNSRDREEQQKMADLIRSYLDGRSHADRDTSDPGDRQA